MSPWRRDAPPCPARRSSHCNTSQSCSTTDDIAPETTSVPSPEGKQKLGAGIKCIRTRGYTDYDNLIGNA